MKSLRALAAAVSIAAVIPLVACASSGDGGTDSEGALADGAPSVILSNSFIGNSWRKSMVDGVQKAADSALAEGKISSFEVVNANGEASEQISQIQSIILKQPDILLVDPASPTALNGVIEKAVDAGITVIAFDSNVTTEAAYNLAPEWVASGERGASTVIDNMGGEGNVLLVRGVAGTTVDDGQYEGWQKVLDANPDVNVVGEVYGDWDQATAQTAVSSILSTLPEVAGVITGGGEYGIVQAFEAAGRDIPVIYGGGRGDFLKWWQDYRVDNPDYSTVSESEGPSIGTAAFWVGVTMFNDGIEYPKNIEFENLLITNENLDEFVKSTPIDGVAQEEWTEQRTIDAFSIK